MIIVASKTIRRRLTAIWLAAAIAPLVLECAVAESLDPMSQEETLFTERILPILKDRCYECHSHQSGKSKGGLVLDSRRGWSEGGGSGPVIKPGEPEQSLLIEAVRRSNPDTAMPPKKPLPESEVNLLTEWVKRGAPDPRVTSLAKSPDKNWWSLKPLPAPGSKRTDIDAFVREKLMENGLAMSSEADRRTLMRRIYFDLHGLAPPAEDLAAFIADPDPGAYEKLVDRLLASPRYGERWARHWFDTIHFADTHGFEHDEIRENAWRYRDYVIAALNADTPWPRFIREQLAADVFFPDEPKLMAALGFLGAGPFDLSAAETAPKMFELVDRDDMVVQTMAAFTSTTTGCARCHDHKFDPITQRDYYAIASVFAGLSKGDFSYDEDANIAAARAKWRQVATAAEKKDTSVLLGGEVQELAREWERLLASPATWEIPKTPEFVSSGGATLKLHEDGSIHSEGSRPEKETLTVTLRPKLRSIRAIRLEAMRDFNLPKNGPGRQDNGNFHLSECEIFVVPDGAGNQPRRISIASATADFNQDGWTIAHALDANEKTAWGVYPRVGESHLAVFQLGEVLALNDGESIRVVLKQLHGGGHVIGRLRLGLSQDASASSAIIPADVAEALSIRPEQRSDAHKLIIAAHVLSNKAARELARLPPPSKVYSAGRSVTRKEKQITLTEPRVIQVLSRGELDKPTEVAVPGALSCIEAPKAHFDLPPHHEESARRAALADWIADPQNPLSWRSIVNRIWHYHFDRGLVDTPNDLGRMGGIPSHPELLDELSAEFRDSGGSLKSLHRRIVLSAAYTQASHVGDAAPGALGDADNRLLWRANRRRLDAEAYRDIVLDLAGDLDLTMGGPSVMHFKLGPPVQNTPTLEYAGFDWNKPGASRRSIYRLVFRNIADPFMVALDFPDTAQLAPTRPFSASPIQALVLWNDAFILRQSEKIAARVERMESDRCSIINHCVKLILLRDSPADELQALSAYAEKHGLAAMCRVLLNTNEFLFVD